MKHSDWQWLIVPDPQSKLCILKYKRPTNWTECNRFDSPEAAADAVSKGKTGQMEWDALKRDSSFPGLAGWLIDPSASPFAPILPIVSDLLRATILPPPSGKKS